MRRAAHSILAMALGTGCATAPQTPRFASWEPLSASIPAVSDRTAALGALAESRRLWQAFRRGKPPDVTAMNRPMSRAHPGYTYVRALQSASDRVAFTIVAIHQEQVVLRALIDANPHQLDRRVWNNPEPRPLWVERGSQVGSTHEGAPALTIDELYDACEFRVLGRHPELVARLYFHPNGLLMQCGFAPGECDDCPTVSIQSVSRYAVAHEPKWLAPSRWLCGTDWGMFPPGAEDPLTSPDFECVPARLPASTRRPVDHLFDDTSKSYEYGDELEGGAETGEVGLEDICQIDPKACATPECSGDCVSAKWAMWRPPVCMTSPTRAPRFLEVGKLLPLDDWAFPFSSSADGIECEREDYLRHVRPTTDEKHSLDGSVWRKR